MEQNNYETSQRASELLAQIIRMWKSSDKIDQIDGLESDPVFRMLVYAIAYQANEQDSKIEQLKIDVLEELQQLMVSAEGCKALPATIAVNLALGKGVPYIDVDSDCSFNLQCEDMLPYGFIPLLKTRAVNATVSKVSRLDSRRWSVTLDFELPVPNLSGLSFSVEGSSFSSLEVSLYESGENIPLISPWDVGNLPVAGAFSMDNLLYNRKIGVNTSCRRANMLPYHTYSTLDLIARCDANIFIVDEMPDMEPLPSRTFIFEFNGVADDFDFNFNKLRLNANILVNATRRTASLSSSSPMVRIPQGEDSDHSCQFMHLLQPSSDQIYGMLPVQVRRIAADRFNEGRLVKLLNGLMARYHSDYHAFQEIGTDTTNSIIGAIQSNLYELYKIVSSNSVSAYGGVYLILDLYRIERHLLNGIVDTNDISMNVEYLTCNGSSVNSALQSNFTFTAPAGFDTAALQVIGTPSLGMDESMDEKKNILASKYYLATDDRIVTPYDLKMFCSLMLQMRFSVTEDMIKGMRICRREASKGSFHNYEVVVNITVSLSEFTRKSFEEKLRGIEIQIERMIMVRSAMLCPVKVKIEITD